MPKPRLEIADILRSRGEAYARAHTLGPSEQRVWRDITRCRTAALGGHLDRCSSCDFEQPSYNSCRNRHCPKCQALPQARWVDRQLARIVPARHFHVVFTMPAALGRLARRHRRQLLDLLFHAASATLLTLGRDPDRLAARLGLTAVLHTWSRTLAWHPHLHCIVTAGGLSLDDERWVASNPKFLFPVKVMGALFRGKMLAGLTRLRAAGAFAELDAGAFAELLDALYRTDWNVYSKAPFAGSQQIYRYLGRYTHRVGLSNHRLLAFDDRGVTFRTRGKQTVTLGTDRFIERFLSHVLPPGFHKIRHYGLMASRAAKRRAIATRLLEPEMPTDEDASTAGKLAELPWPELLLALDGSDLRRCPRCHQLTIVRGPLPSTVGARARAPPCAEAAA